MILGTTFSHRHAKHLQLDPEKSLQELITMGFHSIRLGCYWNEIEAEKGKYDFSQIKRMIAICEAAKQNVIVTVGMKAPRYPEFYFPEWIAEKNPKASEPFLIPYVYKSIEALRSFSVITHWQVENEPLDPSGPKNLFIPVDLLQKEIDIVREKDDRPVIVNLWGNELKKRKLLLQVKNRADIIGIDIYYKVPVFGPIYRGPQDADDELSRLGKGTGKPLYISELQAEPWERNKLVAKSSSTPSMSPELLVENYTRVLRLQPEAVYLWGAEYWLWKKKQGDNSYMQTVQKIIKNTSIHL